MSIGIIPVFQPKFDDIRCATTGEGLLAELEILEDLADECTLPRLSSFADNREVPEDFDGDPEELAERLGPFDEWFPCEEGLECVSSLLAQIEGNAEYAAEFEMADEIATELRELKRVLKLAAARQGRFRFEIA
ncbi:MAG: hypothetical protein NT069_30160 [Planctomycetota bacterium]|nr:hypothetical protein [Planctomycetota bacterium]